MREDDAVEEEAGYTLLGWGGEAVVDGDAVGVDHWLVFGLVRGLMRRKGRLEGKGKGKGGGRGGKGTYEFEVTLQGLHDQTNGLWLHQFRPLLPVSRVDVHREVGDPVDSCRLGVAVVVDVVDMALCRLLLVSTYHIS